MVKREFFLAGQQREITSGQDVAIFPAREFSHIIESLKIKTEPDIELIINLTPYVKSSTFGRDLRKS